MNAGVLMPRGAALPSIRVSPAAAALGAIVAAALFLRAVQFGNPLAGIDEQFYLYVGDRLRHGELPYRDLWDRKPFGLFALFAAIRLLPGDGVLAAQLVATACAAATAWCVVLIARPATGWTAATMAGIFYLAGLSQLGGDTTQTPVFYNLLTAVAALLTLRAADDPLARDRAATAAMLLCGLAVQIKTSAVFAGAFFGLWLLAARWRATRSLADVVRRGLAWTLVAAAPTLAVMALYLRLGAFGFWWQANVTSVLTKAPPSAAAATYSLGGSLTVFLPVMVLAALGFWAQTGRLERYSRRSAFYAGWVVFCIADFVSLGAYYGHYLLPLLLACAPLVAHAFAMRWTGRPLFVLSMVWPVLCVVLMAPRSVAADRREAATVVAHIPAAVRDRCLFLYEGPVALYRLTGACRVTRYPFTAHLSSRREGPSLGVDPVTELASIMARRPAVVVTVEHLEWLDRDLGMERRLGAYLLRDYRLQSRLPRSSPREKLLIWVRR